MNARRPAELVSVLVGGPIEPWRAVGFAVDDGRIPFANGALEFVDGDRGIHAIRVMDDRDKVTDLEGIPVYGGRPAAAIDHPNGAYEFDHIVVMTDSLDRTSAAVDDVLGLEQRRVRESPDVRQAFHRFAVRGCIVEVVESTRVERVGLFGIVCNVADLDAVVTAYDRGTIGEAKDAVQPGRRIATFRPGAGLGVPTALMTPDM